MRPPADGEAGGLPDVVLSEPEEPVLALLRRAQIALLVHPAASQAAFRALVAEGRRYAATDEGRRWRERLAESPLVKRASYVFEVLSMNVLTEDEDAVLPTQLIDAVVQAALLPDMEPALSTLFEGGGP